MIDKKLFAAFKGKTGLGKSAAYEIIKQKQQALSYTVTLEEAAMLVAGEAGVDLSKFIPKEELILLRQTTSNRNVGFSVPIQGAGHVGAQLKSGSIEASRPRDQPMPRVPMAVIAAARRVGIANINETWVDAVVILNFMETAATKFLMDHGFTEEDVRQLYWDDKLTQVQNLLFKEAALQGKRPRTGVLAVMKAYREQRNGIDHEAHLPGAAVHPDEVDVLVKTMRSFLRQIFFEHSKQCPVALPKGTRGKNL